MSEIVRNIETCLAESNMDTYDRYREKRDGCGWAAVTAIVFALLFLLGCLLLPGCASTKSLEQVEMTDSNTTNVHDETTNVEQTENSHHEEHSTTTTTTGTEITFGAGGGTYNAKTGEATNVTSVRENTESHEQSDKIADLSSRIAILQHSNDSLSAQVNTYKHELEKEKSYPKRSGWDRFCTWWFIGTALFLIVKIAAWFMEKNPTTAPWIAIVKKFVPFL